MASYTWREIRITRTEYALPIGTVVGELYKLLEAAWQTYCTKVGMDPDGPRPDDWARVTTNDEEIIVRFALDQGGGEVWDA